MMEIKPELFWMNRPWEKDVVGFYVQMDDVLAVYEFKTLKNKQNVWKIWDVAPGLFAAQRFCIFPQWVDSRVLRPAQRDPHLSGWRKGLLGARISNCFCVNCETQPPASIGWVALSSVVRLVGHLSRIGDISSHLHYMMFQSIQTICFLCG